MADHTERTPKEQEALYRAFAKLYCDASKPETFEKPIACYKALVDPNPPEWSLKKSPYRYLKNKVVQHEIARIKVQNKTVVEELEGMSHAQYVHELLENARIFAARGGLGDSTAASQMYKLIGTAIGALVTKTEDVTKRPELLLTTGEQIERLQEQLTRYKQLTAPVVDADYEILSEESNGRSGQEVQGSLGGQDDRGSSTPAAGGGPSVGKSDVGDLSGVPATARTHDDGPASGEEER